MAKKQKFESMDERDLACLKHAAVGYMCGINANSLVERGGYRSWRSLVARASLELDDPILNFYRKNLPGRKENNAAHLYLTVRGRDMPKKDLFFQGDFNPQFVCTAVYETIIEPELLKLQRLIHETVESDPTQEILKKVFGEAGYNMQRVKPTFDKRLQAAYLKDGDIKISHIAYQAGQELVGFVREGRFDTSPKKKEFVESRFLTIEPREAEILRLRGLGEGTTKHTLAEIARKQGVSRPRIGQIEARAMRNLRHPTRGPCLTIGPDADEQIDAFLNGDIDITSLRNDI